MVEPVKLIITVKHHKVGYPNRGGQEQYKQQAPAETGAERSNTMTTVTITEKLTERKTLESACQMKLCSYYKHYSPCLSHGHTPMPHEMFHAKEQRILVLREAWRKWADDHDSNWDNYPFTRLCERLEKECCL